jgi:hypothetical protein
MSTTLGIRHRRNRARLGIGMPGDNSRILKLARRLRNLVDAPVIGGIAVYLHGGGRSTVDLDFYAADPKATASQLQAAGADWDKSGGQHVLDGIAIHLVTPVEAGVEIDRASVIDGIRVVTLADLIAIKLLCGLKTPGRSRDIGDAEDLIRSVPLDKRFAAKLPRAIRSEFKKLVDAVRAGSRSLPEDKRF